MSVVQPAVAVLCAGSSLPLPSGVKLRWSWSTNGRHGSAGMVVVCPVTSKQNPGTVTVAAWGGAHGSHGNATLPNPFASRLPADGPPTRTSAGTRLAKTMPSSWQGSVGYWVTTCTTPLRGTPSTAPSNGRMADEITGPAAPAGA